MALHGSGLASAGGSSFPATPATNDRYFRTDRGIDYYYDGTRWLSTQLYTYNFTHANGISVDNQAYGRVPFYGVYSLYLERFEAAKYTSGIAEWDIVLQWSNAANTQTIITTLDGSTTTAATTWVNLGAAIGAVLHADAVQLQVTYDEISGTSTLNGQCGLAYRLVG